VAIAVSVVVVLIGLGLVFRGAGPDMATFGWVLVVVGVLFAGVNVVLARMQR
jgi:hypothetical protein